MESQQDRLSQQFRCNRLEFGERVRSLVQTDGVVELSPGIRLTRASQPTDRVFSVSRPALCLIAQGAKEVYVGDGRHRYDANSYLLATIEVPVTGRIIEASVDRPYLGLKMELDPVMVGSVMIDAGISSSSTATKPKAVVVSELDAELLDATVRLVRLLATPEPASVLMPLVQREIVYRLLTGTDGGRMRHLTSASGHSHRIADAIERLRNSFNQPLSIDKLAHDLGMSSSGFHHHFKAITDMSPLQFQKQLRLQEARRLMLGASMDASSASFRVGYEDPSHFSRDYKKLFGTSPIRDVERLREMTVAE